MYVMFCAIWYHLNNFKNVKNTHEVFLLVKLPWRSVTFSKVAGFSLQPATLRKVTLLHGCFSRFLNCANDTKLRNSSLMMHIDIARIYPSNFDVR